MTSPHSAQPAAQSTARAAGQAPVEACPAGCPDYVEASALSRRRFLGTTVLGAAVATTAVFGDTLVSTNYAHAAQPGSRPNVLVLVSMRGAADGLSIVVPHHDPVYYAARRSIAVPKSTLLAADDHFGLHPALAPLLPMWKAGSFGAVHATGLPARNRSHFEAMELLEAADPGSTVRSGWLNRLVGRDGVQTSIDAVSFAGPVPSTLTTGPVPAFSTGSLDDAQIPTFTHAREAADRRQAALLQAWNGTSTDLAEGLLDALDTVAELAPARALPKPTYPDTDLARALRDTARTIKADVGAEAITVDTGTWDHHASMGTIEWGAQLRSTTALAEALAAFFADLGTDADRVTVVTVSEFGRRVRENASGGTDHGYGNVMLLLGAGVRGGRYHGRWPGLVDHEDADLEVTTDYRTVLDEVITARFGSASGVFPGFTANHIGVMHP